MDSAYARLLQQQQLFLQLQILSQQKHTHTHSPIQHSPLQHSHSLQAQVQAQQKQSSFVYQPHPPEQNSRGATEQPSACSTSGTDGPDAEKDKMLVEKQKVIEELTWKLHQEQRQVEELKMQLHKRKRCYGAMQDTTSPPSHSSMLHQQQTTMGQHFLGVMIKQEPMSLSSSCPLSSPKQLKCPPSGCMEDLRHSINSTKNIKGGQCIDTGPSCGSPSTMSAFLSPQCSPQDSPIGKACSRSRPSSPNNPSVLPSSRHVGLKCQGAPPAFSSSESDSSDLRLPPCYEDAVKQQLTRSEQMDELLDVLIESGGCPGLLVPRFHRHFESLSSGQLPYDHAAHHISDSHLQTLLNSPDKALTTRDLTDHPLSPISSKAVPEVQGVVSMAYSETPWEMMEWLELTPLSSATAYSDAQSSIFNAEFLDVTDINLNSAMDLQLQHW
uniref:Myocardin n=1 Tax=Iconisemion striatum TaxID=60296 RepID=A0A1A7X302_9TELE